MASSDLALAPTLGLRPWPESPLRLLIAMVALAACFPLALLARGMIEQASAELVYAVPPLSEPALDVAVVEPLPRSRPAPAVEPAREELQGPQAAVAAYIAKRYRVSPGMTREFVRAAWQAARMQGIDPLLVLAVIAVESSFNPIAESVQGAKGLMQVIPRYHPEKFPSHEDDVSVLDPANNIHAGARIIREYLGRSGDLTAALQMYVGAPEDAEAGYAGRVFTEMQRLQEVARRARSASPTRT